MWANIRAWQMRNGWNDIAYNHGVCPGCGTVYTGRGWGVRSGANGTSAANREWHAVLVMVGEGEPFTDVPARAVVNLAVEHRRRYGRARLSTHRAVRGGGTACPGPSIIRWVADGANIGDDMTPEQARKLDDIHRQLCEGRDAPDASSSATIRTRTWQTNAALGRMEPQLDTVHHEVTEGNDDGTPEARSSRTLRDRVYQSNHALGRVARKLGV